MLSDEREDIRNWLSGDLLRLFDRWVVIHDAEVRADQIEKDAAIADYWGTSEARNAIRAQLKGVSDE